MRPSSSSSSAIAAPSPSPKPKRPSGGGSVVGSSSVCNHSHSATLDLLILLLVLFAVTFLAVSTLSHFFRALSPLAASFLSRVGESISDSPAPFLAGLAVLLAAAVAAAEISCHRSRGRRCRNPRCRGLRKAVEFDVKLQSDDGPRSSADEAAAWREIDRLPFKGGQLGNNPDYECLRAELRRMAPPNGRAVLLFRARCGCAVAKLEAWGPKRVRRVKKGMPNLAIEGGG